jgi:hypothetical protein
MKELYPLAREATQYEQSDSALYTFLATFEVQSPVSKYVHVLRTEKTRAPCTCRTRHNPDEPARIQAYRIINSLRETERVPAEQ